MFRRSTTSCSGWSAESVSNPEEGWRKIYLCDGKTINKSCFNIVTYFFSEKTAFVQGYGV
ncbi:hypothetical protein IMCC3135_28855 [Granulosicoccus antarcticus IMCC3135]|uniref:Uncharacterized protein n=1 Tax=Granulosicoccus antarcticus IMCC3135 TaxID=1192854 RepID=A0A2Z2NX63_9GAMM|nr:hypothetical protein IMCC3135_28855 [Granulosicoccus antarcticus IMCC3135]